MTKTDAIVQFFKGKMMAEALDMGFNFSEESKESASLLTEYSAKEIKHYVRGAEKEYRFILVLTKVYSTDTDDLNQECMNFCQTMMDWIENQNRKRNYPAFPENCQIKKMENINNIPNLAEINPDEGLARYKIPARIVYFEKEV